MVNIKGFFSNLGGDPDETGELDEDLDYTQDEIEAEEPAKPVDTGAAARRPRKESRNVPSRGLSDVDVVLVKPEKFEAATSIADNLNSRKAVVLNLEGCNKEVSRRLVDFLSGVAYANGGDIKRVATGTYLITPPNVNMTADSEDGEAGSNDLYF